MLPATREVGRTAQRRHVSRPAARSPWTGSDAVALAVLSAIGAGGLVACWWGISAEANWHHQLSWVAGAVLSVAVAGLGVSLWLYRGRLRVRRAAAEVWTDLRDRHADRIDLPSPSGATEGWMSGPTMTRYHLASCPLVRGKSDVSSVTAAQIAQRNLRECGACAE